MTTIRNSKSGFTIIELLIASLVFSTILLVVTYSLLQIGRIYYKGITGSKTQQVARNIMDDISHTIQFSSATPSSPDITNLPTVAGATGRFCVGDIRYTFILDRQLVDSSPNTDQSVHVLVRDNSPGCTANRNLGNAVTGSDQELMDTRMRVSKLTIQSVNANTHLWRITLTVISGDGGATGVLRDSNSDGLYDSCQNVNAGSQFCAVSTLSTVVQQRL